LVGLSEILPNLLGEKADAEKNQVCQGRSGSRPGRKLCRREEGGGRGRHGGRIAESLGADLALLKKE